MNKDVQADIEANPESYDFADLPSGKLKKEHAKQLDERRPAWLKAMLAKVGHL